MPGPRFHLLALALLLSVVSRPVPSQDQAPAPIIAKGADNAACGRSNLWEMSGADIVFKSLRKEVWVLDPFSEAAPFILAFLADDLAALPRRVPLRLPPESAGASVLGIAEFPHGEFAGKNLILFDTAFGSDGPSAPTMAIFNDEGNLDSPTAIFPLTEVDGGAVLSAIDIHPQREEIVAYDLANHVYYVLDFSFAVITGPVPLGGVAQFFAGQWGFNTSLRGGGMGIAYGGTELVLASAGFRSLFDSGFILEYDLAMGGTYSGRAMDLGLAAQNGRMPDLAFGGMDTGKVGDADVVFALNFADESLYAFSLLLQQHAPPVDLQSCAVDPLTGSYEIGWTIGPEAIVDSIRIFENGVEVASLGPAETSFVSALPLLGKAFIEVVTEKGGLRSKLRPSCQVENTDTPRIEGVEFLGVDVNNLGELLGIAVTKLPQTPEDFRAYVMGSDTNRVLVLNYKLDMEGIITLTPTIARNGANLPATGVSIADLGGVEVLAVLDGDGATGSGVPRAFFYGLEGPDEGRLLLEVPVVDTSALSQPPQLLDWDTDSSNNFVAGGVVQGPAGQDFAIVRIVFDGTTLIATEMLPIPQRRLTPFEALPLTGIGVSVLPSGNLLVAGSDTFSETYTEALLTTPFTGNPATSARLVGHAQGLVVPNQFFGLGPGHGPDLLVGFDIAHFPPTPELPGGVGVAYLNSNDIFLVTNPGLRTSLILPFSGVIHGETALAHPRLVAEQLGEVLLDIPPAQSRGLSGLSPTFVADAAIDYCAYMLNRSTTNPARLGVTITLDGGTVPEATREVIIGPGRYYRVGLPGRTESRLSIDIENLGTAPAPVEVIAGAAALGTAPTPDVGFRRGDCDADGRAAITDAIFGLNWLFLSGTAPTCVDACDSDDNGETNVTDMIYLLDHLFRGGLVPPLPGIDACGGDPTEDSLEACAYPINVCG